MYRLYNGFEENWGGTKNLYLKPKFYVMYYCLLMEVNMVKKYCKFQSNIYNGYESKKWDFQQNMNYTMYCNTKHIKTIILNATSTVLTRLKIPSFCLVIYIFFIWYDPYSNMDQISSTSRQHSDKVSTS